MTDENATIAQSACKHCGKAHGEPHGFSLSQALSRGDTEIKVDTAYLKCLFDRLNAAYAANKKLQRKLNAAEYNLEYEREFGDGL